MDQSIPSSAPAASTRLVPDPAASPSMESMSRPPSHGHAHHTLSSTGRSGGLEAKKGQLSWTGEKSDAVIHVRSKGTTLDHRYDEVGQPTEATFVVSQFAPLQDVWEWRWQHRDLQQMQQHTLLRMVINEVVRKKMDFRWDAPGC
ncbi:hypothetical protein CKAH01_16721 [Colletotrichum kahawae]|uniref:Uncharacterized protein n=1 Tax=Colletotrichum kahawae TaxID=34407 RepID=A0AAD9YDA9_COLKA|nr:hypothetical protein CKAH01_16721 [Colletotrichum kahawae]